ncbi:hypothetical protein [Tumidithrix helvetica]
MKSIKKALKKLGEIFDRILEALVGQRQPEPQLIPIPVRDGAHRHRFRN